MGFDWEEVEKLVKPSPSFQDIIKRLLQIFQYQFVREHYTHDMKEAETYATELVGGDPKQRYGEFLKSLKDTFQALDNLDVNNYLDFITLVETKEMLEGFYRKAGLSLNMIIGTLKYLQYWVLPSKIYLRELIEKDDQKALENVSILRENGIRFTLDILDKGRTKQGRKEIARMSNVPEGFIYEMVNRADFTRMPYIRGSTIRHYFNIGYNSLEKLSHADLSILVEEMTNYANSIGKDLSRVIELDSGIAISKFLAKIVEH